MVNNVPFSSVSFANSLSDRRFQRSEPSPDSAVSRQPVCGSKLQLLVCPAISLTEEPNGLQDFITAPSPLRTALGKRVQRGFVESWIEKVPAALKRGAGADLSGIASPVSPLAFKQVRAKFKMVSNMVGWVDLPVVEPSTNGFCLSDSPISLDRPDEEDELVQPAGVEPARFDVVVTGDPIEMVSSKRGESLSMAEVELEFLGGPLILSVTAIVPAAVSEREIAFDLAKVN